MRFCWRPLNAGFLIGICCCAFGQTITLHGPTDTGTSSSRFGTSLAATSQHLFIGAPGFDQSGLHDSGNVFSYFLDPGLNFRDHIVITPTADAIAGASVAASKTEIMYGQPGKPVTLYVNSGTAVYFNERVGNFVEITDPVPDNNDYFGSAMAIGKKLVVVGAPGDFGVGADPSQRSGAVYTADKRDLIMQYLPLPAVSPGDKVGAAIAISSKYIAVGAPETTGGIGVVHIFNAKTREFVTTLSIPGGLFNSPHFGTSLAFSGKYLFVGAPDDNFGVLGFPGYAGAAGSVTQFETKTWTAVRTLRAPSIEASAAFGTSLSADKKHLAVGSPKSANGGTERGSAFTFNVKTGDFLETFASASPINGEHYGTSVLLLKTNRLAVGAPAEEVDSREGNVYVHTLTNL